MKNFINEWEKIDHRTKKTKAALVGALSSIIKENRLAEVTVSELARRASVTRKTFYNHYPSVEALVEDVEERVVGTVLSLLEFNKELFSPGHTYEFFLKLAAGLKRQKELWRLFSSTKGNYRILERLKGYLERYVTAFLGEGKEDRETFAFRVRIYLESLTRLFLEWMEGSMKISNEKIAEMASRMTEALLDTKEKK